MDVLSMWYITIPISSRMLLVRFNQGYEKFANLAKQGKRGKEKEGMYINIYN